MNRPRNIGFDLVKLISFVAIVIFHSGYTLWAASGYTGIPPDLGVSTSIVVIYARSLSFSGFTIFWMTFFLMGNRTLRNLSKPWLPAVLIIFWLGFNLLIREDLPFLLTWEVYPLIFLALGTLWLLEKAGNRVVHLMGGVGMILLWIPFWKWEGRLGLSLGVEQALIGVCRDNMDLADWPIFPWIGLAWFAYSVGKATGGRHRIVGRKEALLWGGLLLGSIGHWGAFFNTALGFSFACSVFRMPPVVFWSHLIWPLAMIRLSLDPRVADRLQRIPILHAISRLSLTRHFWLAYVLHYPLAFFLGQTLRHFDLHLQSHALASTSLCVLLSTELLIRGAKPLLSSAAPGVIRSDLR